MRHHSLLFKPLWLMSHAAILALEAINLETEGNIKHAGIFFPKLPFLFEFCSTSVRTHRLIWFKGSGGFVSIRARACVYLRLNRGCPRVACLISAPGPCNIMRPCHNEPFMWISDRREAAARHSAEPLGRALSLRSSTVWKAARFSGRFPPGAMSFTKWMALFSGQSSHSQSIMPRDKWAHSIAFHCRGLFSVGAFAYLRGYGVSEAQ